MRLAVFILGRETKMLTPENLVKNEVIYCISYLVSELAANETTHDDDLYHILGGYEE